MVQSNGSLDSTVVNVIDNSAESLAAYELQSQEFQKTQSNFEDYIERLKEDIDLKAEKFGHIEYYDAKLRDGHSNEVAVATSEVHNLDDRRKSLVNVNPLFAKKSDLPPQPNVEDITFEHISLNLPAIAKNALEELNRTATAPNHEPDSTFDETTEESNSLLEETEPTESIDQADTTFIQDDTEVPYITEDDQASDEVETEQDDEEELEGENISKEEAIRQMSDEELQTIMDTLDLSYDAENFDRQNAIEEILNIMNASEE